MYIDLEYETLNIVTRKANNLFSLALLTNCLTGEWLKDHLKSTCIRSMLQRLCHRSPVIDLKLFNRQKFSRPIKYL